MPRAASLVLPVSLLLAACNVPAETPAGGAPGGGAGPQGGAPQGGAPQGGAPQGGPGGGLGGGVLVDFEKMAPEQSQDDVKKGDHVLLSGKVEGECTGRLRIDIVPTSQDAGGQGMPPGPATALYLDAPGDFTVAVPRGIEAAIAALCDNDGDGRITTEGDLISEPQPLESTTADRDGLVLTLATPPQGGGPQGGGPQGGPPPQGGPGGAQGGPPPQGGGAQGGPPPGSPPPQQQGAP